MGVFGAGRLRRAPLRLTGSAGAPAVPAVHYVDDSTRVVPALSGNKLELRVEPVHALLTSHVAEGEAVRLEGTLHATHNPPSALAVQNWYTKDVHEVPLRLVEGTFSADIPLSVFGDPAARRMVHRPLGRPSRTGRRQPHRRGRPWRGPARTLRPRRRPRAVRHRQRGGRPRPQRPDRAAGGRRARLDGGRGADPARQPTRASGCRVGAAPQRPPRGDHPPGRHTRRRPVPYGSAARRRPRTARTAPTGRGLLAVVRTRARRERPRALHRRTDPALAAPDTPPCTHPGRPGVHPRPAPSGHAPAALRIRTPGTGPRRVPAAAAAFRLRERPRRGTAARRRALQQLRRPSTPTPRAPSTRNCSAGGPRWSICGSYAIGR